MCRHVHECHSTKHCICTYTHSYSVQTTCTCTKAYTSSRALAVVMASTSVLCSLSLTSRASLWDAMSLEREYYVYNVHVNVRIHVHEINVHSILAYEKGYSEERNSYRRSNICNMYMCVRVKAVQGYIDTNSQLQWFRKTRAHTDWDWK